ncbi:DUF2169 family type VI secretion system accessory protein [Aliikangiella sp. IMCC44359]|uniref:DUF2169 family type VI secretion system accessory protein n=1 Tax=Aliikangiella sp. IMCC44359 TaxID=3459125 RepID=UPI00403B2D30
MKLIKPNKIAFLQRTYGLEKQYWYVITPILFFDLKTSKILPENMQWKKVVDALGQEALDHALPKIKGEYFIAGHAYAPDENTESMEISFNLGEQKKKLNIRGERFWKRNFLGQWQPSEPKPFSKVSLTYQNSYGGEKSKTNPLGIGYDKEQPLPAIEAFDEKIKKPGQKSFPAGTLPLPITWPQREKYHGSYKGDWFEKYFPALPPDTDMRLFNAAPEDQQISGFFNGDEKFCIKGMLPEQQVLSGQLPNIRVRSFINYNEQFSEVLLDLDTVWFMPDQLLGALIFRGKTKVVNAEAYEIKQVMLAFENNADEPKTIKHYQTVLKLRSEPATASINVMNESQLSPLISEDEIDERKKKLEIQKIKTVEAKKIQQQLLLEEMPEYIDDSEVLLPEPELSPFDLLLDEDIESGDIDLTDVIGEVNHKLEQLEANAEKQIAELKQNKDINQNIPMQEPVTEKEAIEKFDCLKVQDRNKLLMSEISEKKVQELQLQQIKMKQMAVSKSDEANITPEVGLTLKTLALEQLSCGNDLCAKNLTGVDFSNQVFENVDFSHSILSFSQLYQAKFTNCQFSEVAFVNANLTRCEFENCKMAQSNFSGISAVGVTFKGCDLSLTQWKNCNISQAFIAHCNVKQAQFIESKLVHSYFSECQVLQCLFSKCLLNDNDFASCDIIQTTFSESILDLTRWSRSRFERCVIQLCPIRLASFVDAKFKKVVFSIETNLTRANFTQAECYETSFRCLMMPALIADNAVFKKCDFSESELTNSRFNNSKINQCISAGSNFTNCYFNNCNCYRSRFRQAKFINTNFNNVDMLDSDLMWAQFQDTSIKGCINLSKVALRDAKARAHSTEEDNGQQRTA